MTPTQSRAGSAITKQIEQSLDKSNVAILPPMDVEETLQLVENLQLHFCTTMLDPWYNKGVGGEREDYTEFIERMMRGAGEVSDHVYFWGFPEIVATFVERIPEPLNLLCWLTWYYKNNPSVIRGWRSAQMTCLHMQREGAKLYPEHFLNDAQREKLAQGKLRYMPGPTSVIEYALNIGFVRKKEQTGHPAQKPEGVYERLFMMVTKPGNQDLVLDPMSGSGTTGAVAKKLDFRAILCDVSEEYTLKSEARLGVKRLRISTHIRALLGTEQLRTAE